MPVRYYREMKDMKNLPELPVRYYREMKDMKNRQFRQMRRYAHELKRKLLYSTRVTLA